MNSLSMEEFKKREMTPEVAKTFLEKYGLKIPVNDAKVLLDFLTKLAKLYVEQNPLADEQIEEL